MKSNSLHSQKTHRLPIAPLLLAGVLPTPSVNISSPADGAVPSAPANRTIKATATVESGAVTNVAFFAGATWLPFYQAVRQPNS
jgi:hypothetical protein